MMEKRINEIKKKSVSGVLITSIVQGFSLIGGFILSILLSPEIFGVFAVVAATAAFLSYFSDIGLAAALIQKEKNVTDKDLATTFTIQQILVIILATTTFFLSSYIGEIKGFSSESLWLFRAIVIAFFLSSLKTIPSVLLERELNFSKLVVPQIVEVIVFNIVVVLLAFQGWGIAMFTIAVLLRGLSGLIAIYIVKPWIPKIAIHKESAKKLISFGVPFQLNSLLALVKDNLFIMFLPLILPFSQIGYIGWAKKYSEVPLRLIMDNIVRVTFPAYSRLQKYPDKLSKGVNKTLFILMLFIIPMSIGMVFMIKPLIMLIPKYIKWEPALPSFYLFLVASAVAGVSTPLINALNAIGKIKTSLKFMVFWTVFMWVVAPILVSSAVGFNGVAMTSAIMSLATIAVVYVVKKQIKIDFLDQIIPAGIASLIMAGFMLVTSNLFTDSLPALFLFGLISFAVYLSSLLLLFKTKVVNEIQYIISTLRSK